MASPTSRPLPSPMLERALLVALAVVAIHVPLVPISHAADRAMLPDLLFCLVAAWVVRRPATAPLWLVLALGLAADLMLARPLGLGALGLVLATEALRSRRPGTYHPLVEWLAVAMLFAAVLAGIALLLAFAFVDGPGTAPLARHWIATAVAYPFVALLVHGALSLGARARA